MKYNSIWKLPVKLLLTVSIVALGFTGCSDMGTEEPVSPQQQGEMMVLGKDNPGIARAMEVQDKYTSALMRGEDVVGTGTGVDEDGTPTIVVMKATGVSSDMPTVLEGVPVRQKVVGRFVAYQYNPNAKGGNPGPPGGGGGGGGGGNGGGGNGGGGKVSPTDRFTRPVPIGVSTGNINECASGTIGCRVVDANDNVLALSNNHVFARMNSASVGEEIVQPGSFDVSCATNPGDVFATYASKYTITFDPNAANLMDAALAATSTANLGNATPSDGYGTPGSTPVAAMVNMGVQKYGRTTGHTNKGSVYLTNVTVTVDYGSAGVAGFVDQIIITSRKPFSKQGDSGSLIVTDDNNASPVALLFAGSSSYTIATPIGTVLNYFNVSIDGK